MSRLMPNGCNVIGQETIWPVIVFYHVLPGRISTKAIRFIDRLDLKFSHFSFDKELHLEI